MATFHTNGRIISNPPPVSHKADPQSSAQSSSSSNDNKIRTTYASQIVSKDKSSVTNQASSSEPSVLRTNQISEARDLTTLRQPQQKNNNVAFAAFAQAAANDNNIECTAQLDGRAHPENPCYVCVFDRWGSRWSHRNEVEGTKCGKWVYVPPQKWDGGPNAPLGAACIQKKDALNPCWDCTEALGPHYRCKDCEDCQIVFQNEAGTVFGCRNACPDIRETCTDKGCIKQCQGDNDCRWQDCETCSGGECVSSCGNGAECVDGDCRSLCFNPTCDPLKCEKCERINGVYGCVSPPTSNSRGESLVCCDGSLVVADYEDCYTFQDCDNRQVPICPPGTECYGGANTNSGRQCRDIGCRFDSDCNPLCCEQCTKVVSQEDGSYTNMCLPCGGGSIYSRSPGTSCFNGQCISSESVMQNIMEALDCKGGCKELKYKNTPECTNNIIESCGVDTSCYECIDTCAKMSALYKKPFVCALDKNGKLGCQDPYEMNMTGLSSDLLP